MNKIIICGCCVMITLLGLGIYFYSQSNDIITEDVIELEKPIIDEISLNVSDIPNKIIEVDYKDLKNNCKITKCSIANGCVC